MRLFGNNRMERTTAAKISMQEVQENLALELVRGEIISFINEMKFISRNIDRQIDSIEYAIDDSAQNCSDWLRLSETGSDYQMRHYYETGENLMNSVALLVCQNRAIVQGIIIQHIVSKEPRCRNDIASGIVRMARNGQLQNLIDFCTELTEI